MRSTEQKVLIACITDASGDPRPRRAIELFNGEGYSVDIAGFPMEKTIEHKNHYTIRQPEISKFKIIRLWRKVKILLMLIIGLIVRINYIQNYFNTKRYNLEILGKLLKNHNYDLIIVEDLSMLPQIITHKANAKVLFDAREYYPRQREDDIMFRIFDRPERLRICNKYLSKCDAMTTVSQGISDEYERQFQVPSIVIRSIPYFRKMPIKPVNPQQIKIVHHGVANRNRQIEKMIDIAINLDERFTFDLYLTTHLDYIDELKSKVAGYPKIRFREPVAYSQIIPTLNEYDIGMFYVEPTTFNLKHCLPNKLFEFVQARLMVAISPLQEMVKVVSEHNCGVYANSFETKELVKKINDLKTEEIMAAKKNSDKAAVNLCYEKESKKMVALIDQLFKKQI